ncbi:MAG: hypothetical protein HZC40_07430 [Chloroflexi bacterium]|nr:hypothetical protein [Chloroflexota bacterium]
MTDPLEQFLIEYVDAVGGLADAIEPQVYDVLMPDADTPMRVAFDPDALPEHPSAQLLTFGSALLDDVLARAQMRGQIGLAFLDDTHLRPHALAERVTRDLVLPEAVALRIEQIRPRYVTHTLFWFEVTYLGDEKEQALYPLALDRYYNRQVRYLDELLNGQRFADTRRWTFADATSQPLERAYVAARDAIVRTVRADVHARQHQTQVRLGEQTERMKRYYADLRAELAERIEKAHARGDESESLGLRQNALNREEALRLDELTRKAQLRVQLKLVNLLHVKIPRLFISTRVTAKQFPTIHPATLTLTWDPLVEKTDALVCPHCQRPTFELRVNRQGVLHCAECASSMKTKS